MIYSDVVNSMLFESLYLAASINHSIPELLNTIPTQPPKVEDNHVHLHSLLVSLHFTVSVFNCPLAILYVKVTVSRDF
jgi:hypothetical protein